MILYRFKGYMHENCIYNTRSQLTLKNHELQKISLCHNFIIDFN